MDYEQEYKDLNEKSKIWKPEPGQHKIKILGEPEKTEFTSNTTGETTEQIKLQIEVDSDQFDWYVGKGKTFDSAYGQLMAIGKSKGTLAGAELTIFVKQAKNADGSVRNNYTIPEALELLKKN